MPFSSISRRDFLKLGSLSAVGLFTPRYWPDNLQAKTAKEDFTLGRTIHSMHYYDRPSLSGVQLGYYNTDAVVKVYEKRIGDPEPENNPFWLRTDEGWIHSSYVQPVAQETHTPETELPANGFLAEVTVPYTPAYIIRKGALKQAYRFYYGTTHWVVGIERDSFGTVWYRTADDLENVTYLVQAQDLRRITPEDKTETDYRKRIKNRKKRKSTAHGNNNRGKKVRNSHRLALRKLEKKTKTKKNHS